MTLKGNMQVKQTKIALPLPILQKTEGETFTFPGAVDPWQHVQFSTMLRIDKSQVRCVPMPFQGRHMLALLLEVVFIQKGSALRRKAMGLLKAMHEHMAKCFDIVTVRKKGALRVTKP